MTVKPREGRRARAGAPWIFSNEIAMEGAKALPPGTWWMSKAMMARISAAASSIPKA